MQGYRFSKHVVRWSVKGYILKPVLECVGCSLIATVRVVCCVSCAEPQLRCVVTAAQKGFCFAVAN